MTSTASATAFTVPPATVPDNTYRAGKYAAVNLIWLPYTRLGVGIECLYGEREDKDTENGFVHRIQTAVPYRF
jgi:hypothetical protein